MDDFLYVLKLQLMERISPARVNEQIMLYEDYINEEIAGGKTLEQVMRKLGDPIKVAELIAEKYDREDEEAKKEKEEPKQLKDMTAQELNENIVNPERGFKAEYKENEGWDVRLGKLKLNTWYGKLLIIVIVLAIFIPYNEVLKR